MIDSARWANVQYRGLMATVPGSYGAVVPLVKHHRLVCNVYPVGVQWYLDVYDTRTLRTTARPLTTTGKIEDAINEAEGVMGEYV